MGRKIFSIAIVLAVFYSIAFARVINVPADYATIQAGIDSSADGDTVLVAPGTYYENINFNGHNIVLGSNFLTTGDTSYIESTIIDGDSVGTVLTFNHGEDSTAALIGFTIKHSNITGPISMGITCQDSVNPFILHNIIKENAGPCGGGIYCYYASPTIENNKIINNSTLRDAGYGGGIYCEASNPVIRNNLISGNYSGW
jgi:hypothetical protein